MSKFLSVALSLMLLLFACGALAEAQPADALFTPGTYEAEAKGFGGPVKVTVTVSENEITDVAIEGASETPALGGVAVETLGADILTVSRIVMVLVFVLMATLAEPYYFGKSQTFET